MPYFFNCDACGHHHRIYLDDYNDCDKSCIDCGTDGCDYCFQEERCDDCYDRYQDELDNEGDDE